MTSAVVVAVLIAENFRPSVTSERSGRSEHEERTFRLRRSIRFLIRGYEERGIVGNLLLERRVGVENNLGRPLSTGLLAE